MTAYKDFIIDFPSRCIEILDSFQNQAASKDREVTLAILVASGALIVPYERLKPDGLHPNPSRDNQRYQKYARDLEILCKEKFLNSSLWGENIGSWGYDNLKSVSGDPDSWPELNNVTPMNTSKFVDDIIVVLRNSIAHGSVYTHKNPIEALVFVNTKYGTGNPRSIIGHEYIYVSLHDFRTFLHKWLDFLQNLVSKP